MVFPSHLRRFDAGESSSQRRFGDAGGRKGVDDGDDDVVGRRHENVHEQPRRRIWPRWKSLPAGCGGGGEGEWSAFVEVQLIGDLPPNPTKEPMFEYSASIWPARRPLPRIARIVKGRVEHPTEKCREHHDDGVFQPRREGLSYRLPRADGRVPRPLGFVASDTEKFPKRSQASSGRASSSLSVFSSSA